MEGDFLSRRTERPTLLQRGAKADAAAGSSFPSTVNSYERLQSNRHTRIQTTAPIFLSLFLAFLIHQSDLFYLLVQLQRVSAASDHTRHTHTHTHTHIHTYTEKDSSIRGISPSQRPLPDNTQHSQETDIHAPGGIRIRKPASQRPQTHALDRAGNEIDPCQ